VEHHLSIFRPYQRDAKHEDQLTRAALIVLKLVPLAHEAFLDLCECKPLSVLPSPEFDMQTEKLVLLGVEAAEAEISELVSVFLAPHEHAAQTADLDLSSERRARYDGVIQYGWELLVVIESKLYANSSEEQALKINTGGLAHQSKRYVHVRWQDLLDRWWNLTERSVLGPGEAGVLSDFFDNAEENFGDLLPYTDLERCGDNPGRRVRRLRTILENATGFPAEINKASGSADVKFPDKRVIAFDRINLHITSDRLILSAWPAELTPQYKRVYSDAGRVDALISLADESAWELHPNIHLAYWRSSGSQRWYPARQLSGPEYLKQWIEDFEAKRAGRRPRKDITDKGFRQWLIERKYASQGEMTDLDEWAEKLPLDKFDIRPSVQVSRSWPWHEAVVLDGTGQLTNEIHDSINQLLGVLDEPSLEEM